ncbi:hypothetical protein [Pseudomonas cremoricolorata]|uniref:Uncharacterized protein n=1 Tax=Pseudomonas cremoricolorata TaxID=157783 RepID=A0A089WMF6_9PSED|nr:hypothetical protein [Pseudomonas cremoricolorata]AIR90495.1 hypothetical protein LK03_14895 [Pseudomonas cremoricolorata]
MTELATKDELQTVINGLNERLARQHVINRTLAMILTEVMLTSTAASMVLGTITPMVTASDGLEEDLEDSVRISQGYLGDKADRQEQLCALLIQALSEDHQGIEEKLRETFSRKS